MVLGLALGVVEGATSPLVAAMPVSTSSSGASIPRGDVAFVISGGVSLGVYQAGFLYLTTEAMKRQDNLRMPLVTGASAGSANALIAAINSCLPPNDRPSTDLGWLTWIPVGYRELFVEEQVSHLSTFSRDSLTASMDTIYARWAKGLPDDCDVVLGVTTTRVQAYAVEVQPGFKVPRQEEKFRFRIRGRGYGRPPSITNYIDPHRPVEQVMLPFEDDASNPRAARRNFERLRDVIYASGAFPAAFGPQTVVNCFSRTNADVVECKGRPRADQFVDGGVFDNNPLRLANQIVVSGLRRDAQGHGRWRDLRERYDPGAPPEGLTFVYLDPSTKAYPPWEQERPSIRHPTLLRFAETLAAEWVASARAKELFAATQEQPDLGSRMRLTESHYPMASDHIYAFLGFFERAFRHFDFYLGMYDAYVALDRPASFLPASGTNMRGLSKEWSAFACMVGAFESGQEELRSACDSPELTQFRILVQVSLDRMFDHCRRIPSSRLERFGRHVRCAEAAAGAARVRVLPIPEDADLRQSEDEDRFDYFMRLLALYGFHFKDLGLAEDEAEYGKIKVRRKLLKMLKYLANAQDDDQERLLLLTAGRNLVNSIAYEPPREWWYAEIGSIVEVGSSFLPFDWLESWARVHVATQLKGLGTLLTPDQDKLALVFAVGPELEPIFMTTRYVQPILGVRAAYQLSNRDRFGVRECTASRALDDQRLCSQFLLQGYVAVAVLERVRVQLTLEGYPISRDFDDRSFDVQFGFGVHFF